MSGTAPSVPSIHEVEDALRDGLALGDENLAAARPVLSHLLTSGDQALFSDELLARIRGMANHCARQLLEALAKDTDPAAHYQSLFGDYQLPLAQSLLDNQELLIHTHAAALEAQLAFRLQQRSGIDPVLSPLIQEMMASQDSALSTAAMHVLAAQARFIQQQRRMEMPLAELPGDLFHLALLSLRECGAGEPVTCAQTESRLRAGFDEGRQRIGQITRFIMTLDHKANRALSLDHAGLGIFATALSMATAQSREVAVFAMGENQLARLALTLRAAGLSPAALEEQFLYLHPEIALPPGFENMTATRAADLLAASPLAREPLV